MKGVVCQANIFFFAFRHCFTLKLKDGDTRSFSSDSEKEFDGYVAVILNIKVVVPVCFSDYIIYNFLIIIYDFKKNFKNHEVIFSYWSELSFKGGDGL